MRLIDADYLLDQIDDAETVSKDDIAYCVDCSVEEDAVIVVRCKDCWKVDTTDCPMNQPAFAKNEGFCSCGERDGERRTE